MMKIINIECDGMKLVKLPGNISTDFAVYNNKIYIKQKGDSRALGVAMKEEYGIEEYVLSGKIGNDTIELDTIEGVNDEALTFATNDVLVSLYRFLNTGSDVVVRAKRVVEEVPGQRTVCTEIMGFVSSSGEYYQVVKGELHA